MISILGIKISSYRSMALSSLLLFILLSRMVLLKSVTIDDFSQYWAAGRLNLNGGNPYDNDDIVRQLRVILPSFEPLSLIMLYPPWILPFVMPVSILGHSIARIFWLVLNTMIVIYCADWAWWQYNGSAQLGMVGFLSNIKDERKDLLSGAFAAICAIKPHIVYLFLLSMALWIIEQRRWKVLIGFYLAILTLTSISILINPSVLWQFWTAIRHYSLSAFAVPTIGAYLRRFVFGWDVFWAQYISLGIGGIWFLFYWRKNHKSWQWANTIPYVLMVSCITAAYGWSHDQVILILVVIPAFIWLISSKHQIQAVIMVYIYATLQIIYLLVVILAGDFWSIWLAPALMIWFWFCSKADKTTAYISTDPEVALS